jgi:hypothetical protein
MNDGRAQGRFLELAGRAIVAFLEGRFGMEEIGQEREGKKKAEDNDIDGFPALSAHKNLLIPETGNFVKFQGLGETA